MSQGTPSVCPFCSMGCSYRIRQPSRSPYVGDVEGAALDYDAEASVNRGSLCGMGNMALELLRHPARLDAPWAASDGASTRLSWEDAMEHVVAALLEVRADHGGGAIGLMAGPHLTNEEVGRVLELAQVLGTANVDGGLPEDRVLLGGIARSGARPQPLESPEQLAGTTAILVVGDAFTLAPCIAKPVLSSRYDRRRNTLAVLGARTNRTAWFGRPRLRCAPAREAAALALLLQSALRATDPKALPAWGWDADRVLRAADPSDLAEQAGLTEAELSPVVSALRDDPASGVVLGLDFGDTERPDLVAGLAALLAEVTDSRLLTLCSGPNARGVQDALSGDPTIHRGLTAAEMVEAAVTGDLKALVGFSCDPLGALPGGVAAAAAQRLHLYAFTAPMPGEDPSLEHLTLPCATWGEKPGTVTNAFGTHQRLEAILPAPGAARTDAEIVDDLLGRLAGLPAPEAPGTTESLHEPGDSSTFFGELELYLRWKRRERGAPQVGTHLLLPEALPSHAADGWLTRHLSWPRHERPVAELVLDAADAAELGIENGDRVRVRSRVAEAELHARVAKHLPQGTVLASPHEPSVRALMRWRLDPVLREVDLRPSRVSVEPVEVDAP